MWYLLVMVDVRRIMNNCLINYGRNCHFIDRHAYSTYISQHFSGSQETVVHNYVALFLLLKKLINSDKL